MRYKGICLFQDKCRNADRCKFVHLLTAADKDDIVRQICSELKTLIQNGTTSATDAILEVGSPVEKKSKEKEKVLENHPMIQQRVEKRLRFCEACDKCSITRKSLNRHVIRNHNRELENTKKLKLDDDTSDNEMENVSLNNSEMSMIREESEQVSGSEGVPSDWENEENAVTDRVFQHNDVICENQRTSEKEIQVDDKSESAHINVDSKNGKSEHGTQDMPLGANFYRIRVISNKSTKKSIK